MSGQVVSMDFSMFSIGREKKSKQSQEKKMREKLSKASRSTNTTAVVEEKKDKEPTTSKKKKADFLSSGQNQKWADFVKNELDTKSLEQGKTVFLMYRDARYLQKVNSMMLPEIDCLFVNDGKHTELSVIKSISRTDDCAICQFFQLNSDKLVYSSLSVEQLAKEPVHARLCIPNIHGTFSAALTPSRMPVSRYWGILFGRKDDREDSKGMYVPLRWFLVDWSTATEEAAAKTKSPRKYDIVHSTDRISSPTTTCDMYRPPPPSLIPGNSQTILVSNLPTSELKNIISELGTMCQLFTVTYQAGKLTFDGLGEFCNRIMYTLSSEQRHQCDQHTEHERSECFNIHAPDGFTLKQDFKVVSSISCMTTLKSASRFHLILRPGMPMVAVSSPSTIGSAQVVIHMAESHGTSGTGGAEDNKQASKFYKDDVWARAHQVDKTTLYGDLLHYDDWDYTLHRGKRVTILPAATETDATCIHIHRTVLLNLAPAFTAAVWKRYGYTRPDIQITFRELRSNFLWPLAIVNRLCLDSNAVRPAFESSKLFIWGSKQQTAKKVILQVLPKIYPTMEGDNDPSKSILCRILSEQHIPLIPLVAVSRERWVEWRDMILPNFYQEYNPIAHVIPWEGRDGSVIHVIPFAVDQKDPQLLQMKRVIPEHIYAAVFGAPTCNYYIPTRVVTPDGSTYCLTVEAFFVAESEVCAKNALATKEKAELIAAKTQV